jgi:hypothetical protein
LIDNHRFYWKAWADAGTADPTLFDYNDSVSESQAGSPSKNSDFYPIGALNMMDSTCWIAYNLTPTGNELGGCVNAPAPAQPQPPAEVPPQRVPPPLTCPPGCWVIGDHCECIE